MNETGYDSQGRKIEEIIDHNDGTGTRTVYDPETQTVLETETVDRPLPVQTALTPEEQIAELQDTVDALLALIVVE